MIKAVMLHCGYAEDNEVAGLPMWHQEGFNSAEELLAHLGKTVLDAHAKEMVFIYRDCCKQAHAKHPEYKLCPMCGSKLQKPELNEAEAVRIFEDLIHGTCDSIGPVWESVEDAGWAIGSNAFEAIAWEGFKVTDVVVLVFEYGAELLWYCYKGLVSKGGNEKENYTAILKDHIKLLGPETNENMIYKD